MSLDRLRVRMNIILLNLFGGQIFLLYRLSGFGPEVEYVIINTATIHYK